MQWRYLIYGALGAVAAGAFWYSTREDPVKVVVATVERGRVEQTVSNTRAGTVKACRRANLSPSIGGQIAFLGVREGDQVKQGALLVELWNQDLKAEVALAESELKSAESKAMAACLNAEVARREADRLTRLRERGAASVDELDKVETEALASQADCTASHSTVEVSRSRVSVAKANLEKTRLIAPFGGVVAEINGELNEYVTPSPPGIPTPPVVDLIDNSCFYVSAPIDEVDVGRIVAELPARITLDACGDQAFSGVVRRIAPYVLDLEKQARTVDVEVEFTEPDTIGPMLAGYSADVEIILEVRPDVIRVPSEAILDGRQVYVYQPGTGTLHRREIRTGLANWDWTEVLEGLSPDALVVVNVDNPDLKDQAAATRLEDEP